MGVIFISIVLTVLVFKGIHCDVQFQYDSEQCLGQSVEYHCIVNGSSLMRWSVLDDEGGTVGIQVYLTAGGGATTIIGEVFTVEQLSQSPLISNISFTVQSSINGYTIICAEDASNTVSESLTINIKGPPPPPMDISLVVKENQLHIQWTPPSFTSQCVMISSYSITSNTTNSIITTTDTSVDIPLAGLSPGVYCVSVATVDTAYRTGEYSNQECVTVEVPLCASVSCDYFNYSLADIICQLNWEFNPSSLVPPLQWIYIYNNITNNTTRVSGNLKYEQIIIMRDTHYMFSVFGENVIGNGTVTCDTSEIITLPSCATSTVTCDYSSYSNKNSFAICQLYWKFSSLVPPLQWVYIYNSVTFDTTRVPGYLEYQNVTIIKDTHYMFSVFGENVLGNGTKTCDTFKLIALPSCATVTCEYFNHTMETLLAICQLQWKFNPSSLVPPLQWVYIYNNVTGNTTRVSGNLEYQNITIMRDTHYMFSVFGENVIGNGTETCGAIANVPKVSVSPIDPSSESPKNNSSLSRQAVIGIIVAGVIIVVLVVSSIILASVFYIKRKNNRERGVEPAERSQNKDMEKKIPPASSNVTTTRSTANKKGELKAVSSSKKSTKKESPPRPQPYKGRGSSPPSQVSYSSGRQELHYAEMSHHTSSHGAGRLGGGGGTGKIRSPPVNTSVTYAAIQHQQ